MNTQQQAYINGFVKRANEYGYTDTQAIELLKQATAAAALEKAKANVPLETLFGGGIPGIVYNVHKDMKDRHLFDDGDVPLTWSVLKNNIGGSVLGGLGGAGIGGLLNTLQGADFTGPSNFLPGAVAGSVLGALAGNYRGVTKYNDQLQRKIDQLNTLSSSVAQ